MRQSITLPMENRLHSKWSLRSHVAVACGILVVATAIVTGVLLTQRSEQSVNNDIAMTLEHISNQITSRLEEQVKTRGYTVKTLASIPNIMDPKFAQITVDLIKKNDNAVAWTGVMDSKGNVIAGSGGILVGKNISHRPVFSEGLKGMYYGDIHDAVLLASLLPPDSEGRPTLFMDTSAPILDPVTNNPIGVFSMHLDWNRTRDIVLSALKAGGLSDTEALLLASDGTVMLGPKELVGKNLDDLLAFSLRGARTEFWRDGIQYITGSTKGNLFGWVIVLRQAQSTVHNQLKSALLYSIMAALLIAVGFSIVGWLTAGYISKPLHTIALLADRMRKGEMGINIRVPSSYFEIKILSESLDALVNKLSNRENQLENAREQAERDILTGLFNRRALIRYVEDLKVKALPNPVAIICLDLDGFKAINDQYGHQMGDLLLQTVAKRMSSCIREGDIVSRTGGDEFIMLIFGNPIEEVAEQVASRTISLVSHPVTLEEETVKVGCSAGVAYWNSSDDFEVILKKADDLLYLAKKEGRGRVMFDNNTNL